MPLVTADRVGQTLILWIDAPTFEIAQLRCRALADSLETDEVWFRKLEVYERPALRGVMARRLGSPNFYGFAAKAVAARVAA